MSDGIMYTMPMTVTGTTVVQDLFSLVAGAASVICIHECHIGNESEFGDAAAEMLDIQISRFEGAFSIGSGGSTPTEEPTHTGSPAATTSGRTNDTTITSGGTEAVMKQDTFHVAGGFHYVPTPKARVWVSPTDAFVVGLMTVPDDAINLRGYIVWEEFGG